MIWTNAACRVESEPLARTTCKRHGPSLFLAHDKALLYDFNTAVQLGRKAAKSFSQAFGEHGRETMLANNNLALHLAECGMIPEASKLIGQTAKLARRVLRQDDELRDRIETNAVLIRTSFAKD